MEEDTHDTHEVENPTAEFVEVTTCPRSEFAAVIFHNIPETYPADADVECMYTLTADIYPSTRDYIGLYKVGWMSYRDYVYYEWAPWPVLYEVEKDIDSKVIFPAGKLPTEDGEFYQFCYVMKTGQIRGASMPFQFKRPSADDFVEEEDVEGDMLVIRSKTIVLEEKIKLAQEEKIKLIETQENLERERESLISKMTELNRKLASEQESTAYLTEQLKLSHDRILQLNKEEEDMILVQDQLQQKLQQITETKCDLESEVKALEGRIEEYKQIIKTLENQKDELTGKNKSLEQEKELYKSHVSSSESVVLNHQREVLELRTELESCKAELKVANVDFLAVKVALETEKSELQKRSSSSSADKARIEELQECLRNVEDKLATEENTKKMLSEEINAFVITQEKMSRSLEDSSLESDKLKEQINRFELQTRSLNAVIDQLKSEKQELDKELSVARKELADTEEKLSRLAAAEKEVASLQEQVSCLKEQGETKEATENANAAAHFALQKANVTLRERLEKLTKRCEELQAHNDVLLKKKKQQEEKSKDLLRERDDLRERIHMCSGEYKALFTKNRKLQKKVDKMDKFGVRSKSKDGSGDDLTQSTDSSVKPESPRKAAGKPNLITATLQNKLEMLTSDLEKKCAKKEKYKKLYLDEKERQEVLRKHYYAESRKAEEDMEKLRRKNNNMKEEFDLKYRSMQNLLSKREKELDELSRSRREVVGLLQEKERPSSSPKKEDRVVTTPPLPVLLYPNPYEGVASETVVYPPQRTDIHPLANPYHQLTSTIRYPTETIPESSASCPEQPLPVVMDRSDSVHVEIDRMSESEASGPLDPPLVPRGCLDPPLLPTITPTAKVAAVRSAIQPDGPQCVNDDFVLTLESSMEGETIEKVPITPTVVPSAPHDVADVEEEKYQDADGEAMKICPSCNEAFPYDVNEREFELHIVGHFGKICPLCDAQLEANCSTEDFEKHVNGHFED